MATELTAPEQKFFEDIERIYLAPQTKRLAETLSPLPERQVATRVTLSFETALASRRWGWDVH